MFFFILQICFFQTEAGCFFENTTSDLVTLVNRLALTFGKFDKFRAYGENVCVCVKKGGGGVGVGLLLISF